MNWKPLFAFVLVMSSITTLDVIAWVNAYGWLITISTYGVGLSATLWLQYVLRARSSSC